MFARFVSMRLKNGNLTEFNRILEKEVIPLLQRQKGFREEIVLANPSAAEVVGISIWEQKENAESYNREKFSEVQQLLAKVLDGTPQVKTYEVSHSTIKRSPLTSQRDDDNFCSTLRFDGVVSAGAS